MKSICIIRSILSLGIFTSVVCTGCNAPSGTNPARAKAPARTASVTPPDADKAPLRPDGDMQGVWLESEFYFSGYTALYVEPVQFAAEVRGDQAKHRREAMTSLQQALLRASLGTGIFPTVVSGSPNGPEKNLRLSNTITKLGDDGSLLRVRGQFHSGDKLMAVYELEKSGTNAAVDIAKAVADWMKKNSER